VCFHGPESQAYLGLHQKKYGQKAEGCVPASLFCAGEGQDHFTQPAGQASFNAAKDMFGFKIFKKHSLLFKKKTTKKKTPVVLKAQEYSARKWPYCLR